MEVGHSHRGPSPQTRTKATLGWRQERRSHQGPSSTPVIVVSVINYSPTWIFLGYCPGIPTLQRL